MTCFRVYLVIIALVLGGCGAPPPAKNGVGAALFDPQKIAELEVKGAAPDGNISWTSLEVPAKPEFSPALAEQGKQFFARACAGCHGTEGKGDGPVPEKYKLNAAPADLTKPLQSIKIRSTAYSTAPADEDLFRTLTRGLPGTPMWSYRELSPSDRWALVAYIKTLSPQYATSTPRAEPLPQKLPDSPELRQLGAALFAKVCQNCHGNDGLGSPMMASDPSPGLRFARNGGAEMLGGSSEDDIARTLLTGFHTRSKMMSFKVYLYGDEPTAAEQKEGERKLWGAVHYTRELIAKQSANRKP